MKFAVDYGKRAANCKKCKQKIDPGALRLAKVTPNPFSESADDMKNYFHAACLLDSFVNARSNVTIIESTEDLEGWSDINDADKTMIRQKITEAVHHRAEKQGGSKPPSKATKGPSPTKKTMSPEKAQRTLDQYAVGGADGEEDVDDVDVPAGPAKQLSLPTSEPDDFEPEGDPACADNSWHEFCKLCDRVAGTASQKQKTSIMKEFFDRGSSGEGFEGDVYMLCKLMLPGVLKRVYNINSKQIVRRFSMILGAQEKAMSDHLDETGDVSKTVKEFFEQSKKLQPCAKSTLNIFEVDQWLEEMIGCTKDDAQLKHLEYIIKKCTSLDLMYIVRQLKHDLRINAGAKHVLEALDPDAYTAFQASQNLRSVVRRSKEQPGKLVADVRVGVPVKPMLAEACRSVEQAMRKCPNGLYSEVKYDGERVQLHKKGQKFYYYSRSLKPVTPHKVQRVVHFCHTYEVKVEHLKSYIPQAFKGGEDLILDAEILLVDNATKKPLPFGTLGVHKKRGLGSEATVCLFVFDCLYFNGQSLLSKSIRERKQILAQHMTEVPLHVQFTEAEIIKDAHALKLAINKAIQLGLEGLVLKDMESKYEPGKRHWLKVKKDYLEQGSMADTADLLVLGAYFGTGNKGGIMSVFLMGCYDEQRGKFCTVTKCGNGHDDATLDRINRELKPDVIKISKDHSQVPAWLLVARELAPDFVVKDPKKAPVWEITGAEFSKSEKHTADGISIRFPRVTKIRDDKEWGEATSLVELKKLYKTSKEQADFLENKCAAKATDLKNLGQATTMNKKQFEIDEVTTESDNESAYGASTDDDSDWDEGDSDANKSPTKRKASPAADAGKSPTKRKASPAADAGKSPTKRKASPAAHAVKSPTKRKASPAPIADNETGVSASKIAKEACRYGAKCYQKNATHRERFSHPNDDVSDDEGSFLRGLSFYLPHNVERGKELQRYIHKYDGEVVEELQSEFATHVVVPDSKSKVSAKMGSKTKVVLADWLWECLKQRCLISTKKYELG